MLRPALLSLGFIAFTGMVLFAAPKYANPPLGVKKCVVAFDTGQPDATLPKGQTNWKVVAKGKYNYDDAWTFKKFELYFRYTKGAESRDGQAWSTANEGDFATGGVFDQTFASVEPPMQGEVLVLTAKITVSKTGSLDETDSHAKDVKLIGGGGDN